jgi:lysophospholipase L1-like esterase
LSPHFGGVQAARRTLIVACVLAVVASGCGGSAQIKNLPADAVILCFGDSLTSGKGASEADTYPSALSRLTGYAVINAGVSGELSSEGLERLPSTLEAHKPDLVILCHGANDMLRKRAPEEIAPNLSAMINITKQFGADVILIGVPEPGIFLKPAPLYEDIARQHGVPCEPTIIGEIVGDGALKSDYIHPNAAGYRKLAETIAALIEESQGP